MRSDLKRGFFFVALSSILFGIIPLLIKLTLDEITVPVSCACRLTFMAVLAFLWSIKSGYSFRVTPIQACHLTVFGLAGLGATNLLLGTSYLYINMGLATVCHFIYPVIVVLIMRILFREALTAYKITAILLAVAGLGLLAAVSGLGSLKGILIAAASGVAYGSYVISLDKASFRSLNPMVVVFYVSALCAVFYLIQIRVLQPSPLPQSAASWLLLLISSALSILALLLLARGVACLGAAKASFINMLEPVTNIIVDLLFYHVIPAPLQAVACLLILSSIGVISLGDVRE